MQWSKRVLGSDRTGAWSVYAADIDGDGRRDAQAATWTGNDVIWWRNLDGDPVEWAEVQLSTTDAGASAVHAGDMDGDLEVLAAGYGADDLRLFSPTDFLTAGWLTSLVIEIADGLQRGSFLPALEGSHFLQYRELYSCTPCYWFS